MKHLQRVMVHPRYREVQALPFTNRAKHFIIEKPNVVSAFGIGGTDNVCCQFSVGIRPWKRNRSSVLNRKLYKSELSIAKSLSCVFVKRQRLKCLEVVTNHKPRLSKYAVSESAGVVEGWVSVVFEVPMSRSVF